MGTLNELEAKIKQEHPEMALLLADVYSYAKDHKPMPLRYSGNPYLNALTYLKPEAGKGTHAMGNVWTSQAEHNKRGLAASAIGAGASAGTSFGVGTAVGVVSASGAIVVAGALTGGIAVGVLLLGLAIVVGVKQYEKGKVNEAALRIDHFKEQTEIQRLDDLHYMLTHGQLTELARYQEKALETEKELREELNKVISPRKCVDSATLAYKMYRHKVRLEEKLLNDTRMEHVRAFKNMIDEKICDSSNQLKLLGEKFVRSLMLIRKKNGTLITAGSAKGDITEVKDYLELKWKSWVDEELDPLFTFSTDGESEPILTFNSEQNKRTFFEELGLLLKDARKSSKGDQHDVGLKVTDKLKEEYNSGKLRLPQNKSENFENFSAKTLMNGMLNAGKDAAIEAAKVDAMGAQFASSASSLAVSGGVGFAAGLLVSTVISAVCDHYNDKNNSDALKTESDPKQRIWFLRAMLENGRVEQLYESYKKIQEATDHITKHLALIQLEDRRPWFEDLVATASGFFRIQKHIIKMLSIGGILTSFFMELDQEVHRMAKAYEDDLVPNAIKSIAKTFEFKGTKRVANMGLGRVLSYEFVHTTHPPCEGTCYELVGVCKEAPKGVKFPLGA
ncbi:MAG: hypothetical protein HQK76_14555 [Desulfobacterales bacterium]|nr:hypothetical protein [Desulfobacterales bacterium]